MLARRRGSPTLLTAEDAHRLDRYRKSLIRGETTFYALLRGEGLTLASELMLPFAHWITPEGLPKRFDPAYFGRRAIFLGDPLRYSFSCLT